MATDFEAEGLLDGLEGEARAARLELLERLDADGVPLEELRTAVAEQRLVLLPVERALAGGAPLYTREEVAERAGVDLVESAKRVRTLREEVGIPDDELLQISRVIGMNMSQLAAASRGLGRRVFSSPGDTELEVARRFTAIVQGLGPMLTPTLEYVLELHMREQIRHDVFGDREIAAGVESGLEVAVAFADLVGFTKLGERLDPAELAQLTDRLGEMAGDVARGAVRLVKLIGDAAMLVSNDPEDLLDAALELVAASEREGQGFPLLRSGVAFGRAVGRGGDFYGRPVNRASRITAIARPGSVLCDERTHDRLGKDAYRWSFAGARKLKGMGSEVKLFRARAPTPVTD
jgi:adenylate cyclase